ncbi:MAG TPA: hypothetical protein PK228_10790 [Saprospiraceae bacterium]|nr:hypothetical protein [Saprospiraceae bacterium]
MDYPTGNLTTEDYINGLRNNDKAVVEALYAEFRLPVIRSVAALGGSDASGKSFFRTAIVEAAKQAQAGTLLTEAPFFYQLKSLALAHYKDWLAEKGQPLPESETPSDEPDTASIIPESGALRETRTLVDAWKKGEQTEDARYPVWENIRKAERQLEGLTTAASKNHVARNIFIAFAILTVAWLVWLYVFRSKTPAQVYDENFTVPESLMTDMRQRYGPEMGNDSVSTRPSACEFYLTEADQFYQAKDYESAQGVLLQILDDSLTMCHSDALLYIGIIALEQEEPELALECFSKIEDLEHFGEDIYWYQALAFVKIAELNPLMRDKATRAVERARSNTQDSIRRIQAEKMLKHLAR